MAILNVLIIPIWIEPSGRRRFPGILSAKIVTPALFSIFFFAPHQFFSKPTKICARWIALTRLRDTVSYQSARTQRDRNQSQNNRQLIMLCADDEQFHIPFTADRPLLFFFFVFHFHYLFLCVACFNCYTHIFFMRCKCSESDVGTTTGPRKRSSLKDWCRGSTRAHTTHTGFGRSLLLLLLCATLLWPKLYRKK